MATQATLTPVAGTAPLGFTGAFKFDDDYKKGVKFLSAKRKTGQRRQIIPLHEAHPKVVFLGTNPEQFIMTAQVFPQESDSRTPLDRLAKIRIWEANGTLVTINLHNTGYSLSTTHKWFIELNEDIKAVYRGAPIKNAVQFILTRES